MFNLLIWFDPTAWETDQLMRMPADRFKDGYCGTEAASVSLEKPETLRSLEQIHSLLMYERGSTGPTADIVRFGKIRDIRASKTEVAFRFDEERRCSRALVDEFSNRLGMGHLETYRTHWAIKDGGIPRKMIEAMLPVYDVVLSFAGEHRVYVEQVARYLKNHGVRVFYDKDEQASLWGKDLVEHFDHIYRKSAEYCVVFTSVYYKDKMWTKLERRNALARAIQERAEYILPAPFDDTEIPGFLPTVAFISADKKSPIELAQLIMAKLGKEVAAASSGPIAPISVVEFESDPLAEYKLSPEARKLLVMAASADGTVIHTSTSSGRKTSANGQVFNEPHNRRSEAIWEQAINDLVAYGLLTMRGYKGEVFNVSAKGYEVADALKDRGEG